MDCTAAVTINGGSIPCDLDWPHAGRDHESMVVGMTWTGSAAEEEAATLRVERDEANRRLERVAALVGPGMVSVTLAEVKEALYG